MIYPFLVQMPICQWKQPNAGDNTLNIVKLVAKQELPDSVQYRVIQVAANSVAEAKVKVDLPNQTVTNLATGKSEHFEINGYKKHCLENGLDDVDFLVQNRDKVEAWEEKNK